MKHETVHLGYEVGSGDPVEIPIQHLAVTEAVRGDGNLDGRIRRLPPRARREGTDRGGVMIPHKCTEPGCGAKLLRLINPKTGNAGPYDAELVPLRIGAGKDWGLAIEKE